MTSMDSIHEKIEELIGNVDDDENLEEVNDDYTPYKQNMDLLLGCSDVESYLGAYETMCQDNSAVINCFELEGTEALKAYIEEEELTLDELKTETVQASCDILELIIFDVEADY